VHRTVAEAPKYSGIKKSGEEQNFYTFRYVKNNSYFLIKNIYIHEVKKMELDNTITPIK
jgi:hypothetical protein